MSEDTQAVETDAAKKPEQARGRSTIEFPYLDLSNAMEVAHAVKAVGGTSADWPQIAIKLSMKADGGAFRLRILTSRVFGIVDNNRGHVELTDLGIRIVDPQYERAAKVEAFMRVPLFKALYDKLVGQTLPPPQALERMAEQAGVAPKQKDRARQSFIRSAKQAGMFDMSPDRLAMPPGLNGQSSTAKAAPDTAMAPPPPPSPPPPPETLHPFVKGLLDKLPAPDAEWAIKDRAKWLTTAANIFDLMYSAPSEAATIEITVKQSGGSS
ncbi:MAG: hypothetical protein IH627_18345 [Rubrivivax sp.]|nr:hypothetical protein [Rubrivivax sp.]